MEQLKGKSIFSGIAIGRILFYSKNQQQVKRNKVDDVETELARYEDAKIKAIEQLQELYTKAVEEVGETNAMIFEVHSMMLEDDDYNESVYNIIRTEGVNAEYAVAVTGDNFSTMFAEMEDEYFKARSVDVKDISERVISILTGNEETEGIGEEPVIVVAEDLAPSETVQMDKSKLLAFVTHLGSSNSHTAILARTMSIPALIGIEISKDWNGKMAIVDGKQGLLFVDPDVGVLEHYMEERKVEETQKELLLQLKGQPDITKDGKHIHLFANIGSVADVANVLANDASGIGLFRSEFLYLEKDTYPTEDEQFQVYKTVVQNMAGKKVVIRTLDIGADKQVDYFEMEHEENPAMGYRAIRICLDRVEIFKTQLRALYRASAFGTISIMFPMIISVDEVRQIKRICDEVKQELDDINVSYGEVELGIMIETPAAVMISDMLAKEVDFFSIGTNDLTQYTLAIDRQNAKLDNIYDAHHPAILRMIQMVIDNGHKENCWVGICGELGADTTLTESFIRMGIDELSVSPSMVLSIRNIIVNMNVGE
ncbi:MAG: phosphoenolpyruvate--protein phosphotransferase [Lachnospiraceae bacterium]|nr:phosphoenolpyruvate--protein phosphotransferase [Lachnospiraceae bacterium]